MFGLRRFVLLLYLYGTCLDCVLASDDGYVLARRKVFELHLSVILRKGLLGNELSRCRNKGDGGCVMGIALDDDVLALCVNSRCDKLACNF